MATATLSAADAEKLNTLKSAVAGLNQIRHVLILYYNHYDSDFNGSNWWWIFHILLELGSPLYIGVLDLRSELWCFIWLRLVFCSESEKNGCINLVARYLRWTMHGFLYDYICLRCRIMFGQSVFLRIIDWLIRNDERGKEIICVYLYDSFYVCERSERSHLCSYISRTTERIAYCIYGRLENGFVLIVYNFCNVMHIIVAKRNTWNGVRSRPLPMK